MENRLELQSLLESILGSKEVYIQAPESKKIEYPAIMYSRNTVDRNFADDDVYNVNESFSVILITRDPDDPIYYKLIYDRRFAFNRHYIADNLNHYAFNIYLRRSK